MSQTVFPNLVTNDVEPTLAWYQQNLGATVKMRVPSRTAPDKACFATMALPGNDMMVQTVENIEEKYPHLQGQIAASSILALNIQVSDAQALYENLADSVEVVAAPTDTFYGMREFTISDPNGYLLTVASFLNDPQKS